MPNVTLVFAASLPPDVSGSAWVMGRVLQQIDPSAYRTVTQRSPRAELGSASVRRDVVLPASPRLARAIYEYGQFLLVALGGMWLWFGCREARKGNLLAVFPSPGFVVGAFVVSCLTGRELHLYLHDAWAPARRSSLGRAVAMFLESLVLRRATAVYAISEALAQTYAAHKAVAGKVLVARHPIDKGLLSEVRAAREASTGHRKLPARTIVFTGNVYELNYRPLRCLVAAVSAWVGSDFQLLLCCPDTAAVRKRLGPWGPNVDVRFVTDRAELLRIQCSADVLYVGLGFVEGMDAEIDTAFPTKFVEYLTTGVPIVVHAPAGSYLETFVRETGAAVGVSTLDTEDVRRALRRAVDPSEQRSSLLKQADEAMSTFLVHGGNQPVIEMLRGSQEYAPEWRLRP